MKKLVKLFFVLVTISLFVTGCKKDDDVNLLQGGYWVAYNYNSNDWLNSGGVGSQEFYQFINKNTVKMPQMTIDNTYHTNSLHTEKINGQNYYFCADVSNTVPYTYVIKDNKIYVTNGYVFTIDGSKLYKDGNSGYYIKVSW